MGQNQDKLQGGEQDLGEGLKETRLCPDSEGAGSNTGDVMEAGRYCEEEAGNTGENPGEPDIQDLDGSPGQEPKPPSSEKHINLRESPFAAREVRQGGAAGKEGGGGDGGETFPVVPQETDKNQKSSSRIEERAAVYKLFNRIKKEEKNTEEQLQSLSKIKMEYQGERTELYKKRADENVLAEGSREKSCRVIASEDANCLGSTDSALKKISRCHAGELLSAQDQNETRMAEAEDIKLSAGTVGYLSERKELPPAQPQHPLKNNLQKESLLDMSDTIHCRRAKERTEIITKEETLTCKVKPVLNDNSSRKPKVTEPDDQRESVRPYLQKDTAKTNTIEKIDSGSRSNPLFTIEPSSILEKLLKRNRKEATPDLSEAKEVDFDKKEVTDVPVEMNVKKMPGYVTRDKSHDRIDQSHYDMKENLPLSADSKKKTNIAKKDQHIGDPDKRQTDTDDRVISGGVQSGITGNIVCDSALSKSHYDADCQSSKKIKPTDAPLDMCPSENLSSDSLQSAVSHERKSCEESGVITEASAPSSVSGVRSPPTRSDGRIAESCHLLKAEKIDTSTVRLPVQTNTGSECKINLGLSESEKENVQSVRNKEVKNPSEDTVDSISPDQLDEKPGRDRDDGVVLRDHSKSTPKSRPVSELIKETIQMHEKLQHHERPKPAEVKSDEQGQSVKVAQMKAAFDSPQRSPDKAIDRKPSVRKEAQMCRAASHLKHLHQPRSKRLKESEEKQIG